jgi:hypothetical protein
MIQDVIFAFTYGCGSTSTSAYQCGTAWSERRRQVHDGLDHFSGVLLELLHDRTQWYCTNLRRVCHHSFVTSLLLIVGRSCCRTLPNPSVVHHRLYLLFTPRARTQSGSACTLETHTCMLLIPECAHGIPSHRWTTWGRSVVRHGDGGGTGVQSARL